MVEIDLQPVSAAAPENLIALSASSPNMMNATPEVRWRLHNSRPKVGARVTLMEDVAAQCWA